NAALDYVREYVLGVWSFSAHINPDTIVAMGHSQGGETARYVTNILNNDPDLTVRATVNLAPTEHTDETVFGNATKALQVLYGSMDSDVPPEQAYRVYDTAGTNEASSNIWDMFKSMKLLSGDHYCFVKPSFCGNFLIQTKGYVRAFLDAHVLGDWSYYDAYIRGDAVPGGGGTVASLYSDGSQRLVIDNAERLALSPHTLNGSVTALRSTNASTARAAELGSPHDTTVLVLEPSAANAWIRWQIPALYQNPALYRMLSFRI